MAPFARIPVPPPLGALRTAPSLPRSLSPEVRPAGDPDDRLDDAAAAGIRRQIMDLVLALNTALPVAAGHASDEADRRACQAATVLSSELGDCYEGRLRPFLNPWRTEFGPGTVRIRGQGKRKRR